MLNKKIELLISCIKVKEIEFSLTRDQRSDREYKHQSIFALFCRNFHPGKCFFMLFELPNKQSSSNRLILVEKLSKQPIQLI
jgi:hypothetical protein